MTNENNEGTAPQSQETPPETPDEVETPRAKTPLELVREREAKMRGHTAAQGRTSQNRQTSSAANSYKRRQHQRRAG